MRNVIKSIVGFIIVFLMALGEVWTGRLALDEFLDYVAYMFGVAAGRELYFDPQERLS